MAYIGKSPSQGVRSRFQYQATAGQSSFSSTDANGLTLTYTDSLYMDVYQNGILLVPGDDYTATTGTTVVLVQSASLDDIIEMVVYDVFSVPDAVSQSAGGTFSGNVTMGNNLTVTGQITETGKEYFHVDLTTQQVGLTDNSITTVDFGGSGTVKYDTKSNFDSANDAYLLDSSDGVYLISYSIGIMSDDIGNEELLDAGALLRVATDGSTFSAIQGQATHTQDESNNEMGSISFSGTFIYKSTNATTKIDLQGFAASASTFTYEVASSAYTMVEQSFSGGTPRPTFLTIVRIA